MGSRVDMLREEILSSIQEINLAKKRVHKILGEYKTLENQLHKTLRMLNEIQKREEQTE